MDLRQPPAGQLSWSEPKEIMNVKEGAKGISQKSQEKFHGMGQTNWLPQLLSQL